MRELIIACVVISILSIILWSVVMIMDFWAWVKTINGQVKEAIEKDEKKCLFWQTYPIKLQLRQDSKHIFFPIVFFLSILPLRLKYKIAINEGIVVYGPK